MSRSYNNKQTETKNKTLDRVKANRNNKVLLSGYTLYWEDNEVGGRTYYSDEVGLYGAVVWDTSLISKETLRAALIQEAGDKEKQIQRVLCQIEDNDPELLKEVADRILQRIIK